MCKKPCRILVVVLLLAASYDLGLGQSQSDYALIRQPVFTNPLIWKLTRSVTNQYWNIDLFLYPRSSAQSFVMDPGYYLYSAVSFTLDKAWNRIIYIEALDDWIREYSSYGQGTCQVWWPRNLDAVVPCNEQYTSYYYYVYVADTHNDRIMRFRYNWPNQFVECNTPITGGGLQWPADLDLNDGGSHWSVVEDNYLWVVNAPNGSPHQIKRFTVDGVLKSTFGEFGCDSVPGHFCKITAIASGRSAFMPEPYTNNDHLYVADAGNNRVVWLIKWHGAETVSWMKEIPASAGVVDLEVDYFGQVWVVDREAGTLTKYTYDLFPLCVFGSTGTGENQFIRPISLSTPVGYLGNANMFVVEDWTDSSGGQYFGIGTDVVDFSVSSCPEEHIHYIDFVLIDPSIVSIKVYNAQGGLVKSVFQGGLVSGNSVFVWDGTNESGIQQPTGDYRVEVVDTSAIGSVSTGEPINVVTKEAWVHHVYNCCNADGIRGDVNNDCTAGCVTAADLTFLVAFLFQGGPEPACLTEANADGVVGPGGPVDAADLTYLVAYLFQGGAPPPPCP
ncbi:MAG: FlgD immunoglobulin-like domain containing protein [Candidatus Zixiibacteriota bacterium]